VIDKPLTDEVLPKCSCLGQARVRFEMSDYDPRWPTRFEARADELRAVLSDRCRLIEHIGSTSVPGLAAKPVIDIALGIDEPDDEPAYLPDLEAIGYELRVREPQHRCLRVEGPDGPVNLHCYPPEHPETRKYLVFRNRLRADENDRLLYETAKRSLADREWPDMNYYAEAKQPVIHEILERAGWRG
jgi:GrpB-like predicted nucleotidyltransferase (UPF0157 family)